MIKLLNKLYSKNKLIFSLIWIGVYCILNSIANPLSEKIGIDSSITLIFNTVLSAVILIFIKKNSLMKHFGLCKSRALASSFLFYIPLILFMSNNFWLGFAVNLPLAGTVCYILNMLFVGFLEEIIFRGFLFKALAEDNVKSAVIISSVTFGIGHILNLFNGSGMELVSNLCQIVCAVFCGFLFVIIFHRGGSLIPCIIAHSVNNAISVFANEGAMTTTRQIIISTVITVLVVSYTLILLKTLPRSEDKGN